MKTQVHFRGIHPVDDAETRRYAKELSERLDRIVEFYREDQKRLRLVVEGHRQGYRVGGSMTVPNKALYAEGQGDTLTVAMETLFDRLRKELLRHRAMVRKEYLRKRKYSWQEDLKQAKRELAEQAKQQSKEAFHDRFLPLLRGLYRTARRRIILHQLAGELEPNEMRADELISDLVWWEYERLHQAEADDQDMAVRLHRRLRDKIEAHLANRDKKEIEIPADGPDLEDPRFGMAEDETQVFYEPPEKLRWEDLVVDNGHPEIEIDETPVLNHTQLIYRTLSKLDRSEREAYMLHAIEGWNVPEVAAIAHIPENEVQSVLNDCHRFIKHELGV